MLSVILFLHILVAVVMAGVAAYSLVAIVKKRPEELSHFAKLLSVLLLVQAASGSLLGLLSPEFSVMNFCVNVTSYIGAYILVELAIFFALKRKTLFVFPHRYAWTSASVSFALLILVVFVRT